MGIVDRAVVVLLACMLAWTVSACSQASLATPEPRTISIAGATAMQPVLRELTAAFSRQHPNVIFTVRGGGSTLGEEWARSGRADLGASALPVPGGQPARQAAPIRIPIGLDGIAIVVHPSNDVSTLTLLQLQGLYSGRILDWVDVGGAEGEVLLVSREDGSGTRSIFEERVMREERVALTAVVMPTSADVVEYVANQPQAIGYVSRAYVADLLPERGPPGGDAMMADQGSQEPVDPVDDLWPAVQVIEVEGLLPTVENLTSQRYHLTFPLYLVSRREPSGQVRQFTDFVLSPAGQEIVVRFHARVR